MFLQMALHPSDEQREVVDHLPRNGGAFWAKTVPNQQPGWTQTSRAAAKSSFQSSFSTQLKVIRYVMLVANDMLNKQLVRATVWPRLVQENQLQDLNPFGACGE